MRGEKKDSIKSGNIDRALPALTEVVCWKARPCLPALMMRALSPSPAALLRTLRKMLILTDRTLSGARRTATVFLLYVILVIYLLFQQFQIYFGNS